MILSTTWLTNIFAGPVQDVEVGTNAFRTLERKKGKVRGLLISALLPKTSCDFTHKKELLILRLALWGLYIVVASSEIF